MIIRPHSLREVLDSRVKAKFTENFVRICLFSQKIDPKANFSHTLTDWHASTKTHLSGVLVKPGCAQFNLDYWMAFQYFFPLRPKKNGIWRTALSWLVVTKQYLWTLKRRRVRVVYPKLNREYSWLYYCSRLPVIRRWAFRDRPFAGWDSEKTRHVEWRRPVGRFGLRREAATGKKASLFLCSPPLLM